MSNRGDYDYVSNVHPATFPDGLDVEVFSNDALKKTWKESKNEEEREHTTTYMWNNPSLFRIGSVLMSNNENLFIKERWTVDYPEDFEFVKIIYENLYDNEKVFDMNEILKFLTKREDIRKINQHLIDKNAVH